MKSAKLSVAAYYVQCPHCDEVLESRSDGSQMISLSSGYQAGERVECPSCGRMFRIPQALSKVSGA
jgi:uncharacterized C2H2 Zn-finger protein